MKAHFQTLFLGFKQWWDWWYLLDYAITVVLAVVGGLFDLIPPTKRFLPSGDASITYPLVTQIFPTWALIVIIVCVSLGTLFLIQIYYRSLHDLHHSVLGICEANALTTFITNALKAAVGRYRPKYLAVIANPGSSQSTIDDARMSFPSGHSSSIYTSMVFLSLYLAGKIGVFRKHNHPGFVKVFIAFLPITIAVTVSVSRLTDYSHNVDDVIAGALIGTACAALTYFTNYGSLFDKRSHLPRNRHRVLSKEEQASASNRLPSPVLPQ